MLDTSCLLQALEISEECHNSLANYLSALLALHTEQPDLGAEQLIRKLSSALDTARKFKANVEVEFHTTMTALYADVEPEPDVTQIGKAVELAIQETLANNPLIENRQCSINVEVKLGANAA